MSSESKNLFKLNRAMRDLLLEAPDAEIDELLEELGEDSASLVKVGKEAAERALSYSGESCEVVDLHRGLGTLIQLLRREKRLTIDQLSKEALVNPVEIKNIEINPEFDPSPRTIYQLEQFFKLRPRSLVILSGVVEVHGDVRKEAVRFAASSKSITELSRKEHKLLNGFIKILREHTDE